MEHNLGQVAGMGEEVAGLSGLMAAYQAAVHIVQLYGPTNFAPTIRTFAAQVRAEQVSQKNQKYFVLMLLTVRSPFCAPLIENLV
jgi:hypothetical protein